MKFARTVWKILVAIKDGLVLVLLLLFFGGLSVALSMKPSAGHVQEGALAITLDGPIVEERAKIEPRALLLSGGKGPHQFVERELARVIEAAANDTRIRAVTLDLDDFGGGSEVALSHIGAALDKVRHAGKPVLTHAVIYDDKALQLAAHGSEIWVDPLGGALVRGPGGTGLFVRNLLEQLKIKVHVFKVGTYKSAVEPYIRDKFSPEAKEAEDAVFGALWHNWQDEVKAARPRANLAMVLADPVKWLAASGNDAAKAAVAAGLADRIGDKVAFGQRVAELVGTDKSGTAGAYKSTKYKTYLADLPAQKDGKAIAVVTIAGEIVDGDAGPGAAGGDRIATLIDKATTSGDYAGMVVRVDSPGGSVMASERIRAAINRFKAKHLPVAVSMGSLAASGGYWVSTPGERIFAEPSTITGSIGIFAIVPSFEDALSRFGVTTDSIRTTTLSAQPDVVGGLTPVAEGVIQAEIDEGYQRFIGLVAASRHKTTEAVDKIGQGRIWDGGTARQLGLVDEFGGLDQTLAWVGHRAGAEKWHPVYLGDTTDSFSGLLQQILADDGSGDSDADDHAHGDLVARIATARLAIAGQLAGDVDRLLGGRGAQAYCLECASVEVPVDTIDPTVAQRASWLAQILGLAPRGR